MYSYWSDLQRNFSSLFQSASFLCHRLPAHPASPSACCQGSKCHTASVSYFSSFLPHWNQEWEKQIWGKAKIKWLERRESLWTYNNHCRRGGTWTGSQARSSSAELLSKEGTPTEMCHSRFPTLLLCIQKQFCDSNQPLPVVSWETLSAPKSWLLWLLLQLIYTVTTQWHTTEPNLSHSWAPECNATYFMKANRQISSLFQFH